MKKLSFAPLLLAGILLTTTATASDDVWKSLTSHEGSITLSLPPTWVNGNPKDPKSKEDLAKLKETNPLLYGAVSGDKKVDETQILLAYDGTDIVLDDEAIDTISVQKRPSEGLTPELYDLVGKEIEKSLPHKGAYDYKIMDVSFGKMLVYWTTMVNKDDKGKEKPMDVTGAMFVKGENMFVATIVTGEHQYKDKKEIFEKIFKSVTLK